MKTKVEQLAEKLSRAKEELDEQEKEEDFYYERNNQLHVELCKVKNELEMVTEEREELLAKLNRCEVTEKKSAEQIKTLMYASFSQFLNFFSLQDHE